MSPTSVARAAAERRHRASSAEQIATTGRRDLAITGRLTPSAAAHQPPRRGRVQARARRLTVRSCRVHQNRARLRVCHALMLASASRRLPLRLIPITSKRWPHDRTCRASRCVTHATAVSPPPRSQTARRRRARRPGCVSRATGSCPAGGQLAAWDTGDHRRAVRRIGDGRGRWMRTERPSTSSSCTRTF